MDPDMAAPAGYRVSALDIRRLSLFLAVVEHDGFTRAAHAVHTPSPPCPRQSPSSRPISAARCSTGSAGQ